jgi:methionyl-tRNA synthetase
MTRGKRLYITTAIDYVNSRPHIGTAYEKIGADVLNRYYRLQGWETHLQMGNDEHSTNVEKSAAKQGLAPLVYCGQMEQAFRQTWDQLTIQYDGFIRTTDTTHHDAVRGLFQQIHDRTAPDGSPNITKGKYTGWYCESCEAFYTEKDLVDTQCPLHKKAPKWVEEENYFFALSKYQDFLLKHITEHPEFILPAIRRNEIVRLIEDGLQDISISREGGSWGIHLPIDEGHTVYVWFDALINYITATGFQSDAKKFKHWWSDATIYHVIGKDITRFHCVIWPAMLQAAGLALPKTIFGHGFVYHRGERMSKTLGNVVDPLELVGKVGADPLRYFLLRENSFGSDGNFTWDHFIERYNGDLANGIGNLVSRTMGMIHQYSSGTVPKWDRGRKALADATAANGPLRAAMEAAPGDIAAALALEGSDINFHEALASIWKIVTAADRYINENKPWALQKSGETEKVSVVLACVTEAIAQITCLLTPFMPQTAQQIWTQMGYPGALGDVPSVLKKPLTIGKAHPLFPRLDTKENTMNETAQTSSKHQTASPVAGRQSPDTATPKQITIGDFAKVELRVGTITAAAPVEGADRLLTLQVDLGTEQRQLVAGIAQHYGVEALVGKQVCVVANLKPATLRGVESQGMVLCASGTEAVVLMSPLIPVPNGTQVK